MSDYQVFEICYGLSKPVFKLDLRFPLQFFPGQGDEELLPDEPLVYSKCRGLNFGCYIKYFILRKSASFMALISFKTRTDSRIEPTSFPIRSGSVPLIMSSPLLDILLVEDSQRTKQIRADRRTKSDPDIFEGQVVDSE